MKDKREMKVIFNDFFLLFNENSNTFTRLATMPKQIIKMKTMAMLCNWNTFFTLKSKNNQFL